MKIAAMEMKRESQPIRLGIFCRAGSKRRTYSMAIATIHVRSNTPAIM